MSGLTGETQPYSSSYEAVADDEQRAHVNQVIHRARVLFDNTGVDAESQIGFNPYFNGLQHSASLELEDGGDYSVKLIPFDGEGRGPIDGYVSTIKYNPNTGKIEYDETSTWATKSLCSEGWEENLAGAAVLLFDSFLESEIKANWDFLNNQRTPEQREEAKAHLAESKAVCQELVASAPWVNEPVYNPNRLARSRTFEKDGSKITELQFGNLISPKPTFMQRVLRSEIPNDLWEDSTRVVANINTSLGVISYDIAYTTDPFSHAVSYDYMQESEGFDNPAQLHMESDLVEELRKLKAK